MFGSIIKKETVIIHPILKNGKILQEKKTFRVCGSLRIEMEWEAGGGEGR